MNHDIKLTCILLKVLLLSACGGGGEASEQVINEPISSVELNCETECTTITMSFNSHTSSLFYTPNQSPDLTNAQLSHEIYQDSSTNNYVFTTSAQQITDENSPIQSITTKVTFGYDSFPIMGIGYPVVDPAFVYSKRNHGTPYIRGVSFDIQTSDDTFYEGSTIAGDIFKIRVMAPVENLGDEISDVLFKLLDINVENYSTDLSYQLSFSFTNNGEIYTFDQTVTIHNDDVIAFNIPPIIEEEQTELSGCWSDQIQQNTTFCFDTLSEGRYIQNEYNGEPGVLTSWFSYDADFNTGTLNIQNHHKQLQGSCCDTEIEAVNEDLVSEAFMINGNILTMGQSDFKKQ